MNAWMEELAKALRAHIVGDDSITTFVDTRVYPAGVAENPAMPYITYTLPISSRHEYVLGVVDPAASWVRFQVDWYSTSYTEAVQLGDALFVSLATATLTVSGWGSVRVFPLPTGFVEKQEEAGVTYFRGMHRYWVLLCS